MRTIGRREMGAALALVVFASACATDRFETSANFDTDYDFASVETFSFHGQRDKAAQTTNGQIIEMTVREELTARNYHEVSADEADVYVHYDYGRYAPAKLSGANSFAINRGTLTLSVLDPKTMRTVWYGWVETNMRPQDDGEVVIAEALDALLRGRLPDSRAPRKARPVAGKVHEADQKVDKAVDEVMDDAMGDATGKTSK